MAITSLFDADPGGSSAPEDGLARACGSAAGAVGNLRDAADGVLDRLDHPALLARLADTSEIARDVQLTLALMSREVEVRSDDQPAGGLARRHGHRDAADLIAAVMGVTKAEALRLLAVGRALEEAAQDPESEDELDGPEPEDEPDQPDSEDDPDDPEDGVPGDEGEAGGADRTDEESDTENHDDDPPPAPRTPPRYPYVTAALNRREISIECATLVMSMLDTLSGAVDLERRRSAERELVDRAAGMSASQFARVVTRFKAALDVEEQERRVSRMRAARSLRMFEDRDGMLVLTGRLDPETGAPVRAALEALVGDAMRRSRENAGQDIRTADQMRADSLATLARHALGCTATDLPLSTVTVVVRVKEQDLQRGLGLGEVDGCTQPLDIATLRRMAADADLVPAVLGRRGELLDLGRKRRLFTRAQRLALIERDGGCAFCGAPPAWTEVHHIKWWSRDRGETNLANGVLLCSHCHHVIHDQGWGIEATATEIWFRPPYAVDTERRLRRGGRARFHAPEWLGAEDAARGGPAGSGASGGSAGASSTPSMRWTGAPPPEPVPAGT